MVEEAGGRVINSVGRRFDILNNKSLISGNKHIVKKLLSEIKADEI